MAAPIILEIQITQKQREWLERLVKTGLFGSSVDEVVEYFIADGLRGLWRDGMIGPNAGAD